MIDNDIDEAALKIALHCGRGDTVLDDYRAVAKAYAARLQEAERLLGDIRDDERCRDRWGEEIDAFLRPADAGCWPFTSIPKAAVDAK